MPETLEFRPWEQREEEREVCTEVDREKGPTLFLNKNKLYNTYKQPSYKNVLEIGSG